MSTTVLPRRPLCVRCRLPQRACLCAWIRPTANHLALLVLQHPLEAGEAKGSLRLLHLSLGDCRCEVGERFETEALANWLGDRALLLYPGEAGGTSTAATTGTTTGSTTAMRAAVQPAPAPQRLVLLDGTWRKTRKLLHLNPLLQRLPRCALQGAPPSLYRTRKAQRPEQRSTLEAACLALGALEGRPAFYAPLLQAFEGWVQSQDPKPS